MAETSVPVKITQKLGEDTKSIVENLRKEHKLDVRLNGTEIKILNDDDMVVEVVIDYLKEKANIKTRSKPQLVESLEGQGKILTILKGLFRTHWQNLFRDYVKDLHKEISLTLTEKEIKISCSYEFFPQVKTLTSKLNDVKACTVDLSTMKKDKTLAQKFMKDHESKESKNFYCCITDDNKLIFYGLEDKYCEDGKRQWVNASKPGNVGVNRKGKKDDTKSNTGPQGAVNSIPPSQGAKSSMKASAKQNSNDESSSTLVSPTTPKMTVDKKGATTVNDSPAENVTGRSSPIEATHDSQGAQNEKDTLNDVNNLHTHEIDDRTSGTVEKLGGIERYSFNIRNLHVMVYKKSITEITQMDAITNAANDKLMHGGGVAYYISKAAGPDMNRECKQHIDKYGTVALTENFVSVPGFMKCKGIIHAVGPTWYDYKDTNKDDCARDVCNTVKNVLQTTLSKKWKKVALPAISSGLFGVPKTLCAEMYIKAFVDFAIQKEAPGLEVHFIDLNEEILDLVKTAHKTWVDNPGKIAFKNAFQYPTSAAQSKTKRGAGKTLIQLHGTNKTSYGEKMDKYCICETLDVHVYKGSLIKLQVDAILVVTIATDDTYISHLQNSIGTAAGSRYISEIRKYRNRKEGDVIVTGGGDLPCKKIVHVVLPFTKRFDKDLFQNLSYVYRAAITCKNLGSGIRSIGMPLFYAGAAPDDRYLEHLVGNLAETLIDVCTSKNQPLQVKEFHLVNLDACIPALVKKLFSSTANLNQTTRQHVTGAYNPSGGAANFEEEDGWIRHRLLDKNRDAEDTRKSLLKGETKPNIEKAPPNTKCAYCPNKPAEIKLECNHMFCNACSVPMKGNGICMKCKANPPTINMSESIVECPICCEHMEKAIELPCSHKVCKVCYDKMKAEKPQCPFCQVLFGVIRGNQPDGEMYYRHIKHRHLPKYEDCGIIEINYLMPSGKQAKSHPHPGRPYHGTERRAYLPDNMEGNEVLRLLRIAFDRRLIFTIGESRTSGREDAVTWNDIHHKTHQTGGPERYGYPDPEYLGRVKEELAAKGVAT